MSKKQSYDKVAKRESTFATEAHKEGLGAKKRAKQSSGPNKKDNLMEAKIDEEFAVMRGKLAKAAKAFNG